jgi:hypothetical protein
VRSLRLDDNDEILFLDQRVRSDEDGLRIEGAPRTIREVGGYRNGRKNVAISPAKTSGASSAAK